jgi:hypothetical protein
MQCGKTATGDTCSLPNHPDVKLQVRVSDLLKAYTTFPSAKILFTERCVILTDGDLLRLVSACGAKAAKPKRSGGKVTGRMRDAPERYRRHNKE